MNKLTGWWLAGCLYVLAMLWLSLSPGSDTPPAVAHADKLLHFSAHFVLCGWFFPLLRMGLRWRVVAFSLLLGLAIEALQSLVPLRQPDVWDLLANAAGALAAYACLRGQISNTINQLILHKKNHKPLDRNACQFLNINAFLCKIRGQSARYLIKKNSYRPMPASWVATHRLPYHQTAERTRSSRVIQPH